MDLGADICCDSAHKTLPGVTGGAYLHISKDAPELLRIQAKQSMALFASTSPSYLILQSLDQANTYLADKFAKQIASFIPMVSETRKALENYGYTFLGNEPMKLTVNCKNYGYTGYEMAAHLQTHNIHAEFADPDYLVLMPAPEIGAYGLKRLETALQSLERLPVLNAQPPLPGCGEIILSPREAALSPCETLPIEQCLGRILARASVACPPAVPIVVCGERITEAALACFAYYGIEYCNVLIT